MNKENVDFLKERMFFLGFGDRLNTELEKKISQQPDRFTMSTQGEFIRGEQKSVVDYALDFSKSKQNDMYFANNYTATLKNEDPAKEVSHKFYLNNGSGVTAKEAFNLLEGRAVHKTNLINKSGDKYEAWMQLNLKEKDEKGNHKVQQYHKAWNYDLESKLLKLPVKELDSPAQKEQILTGLKKGNLVSVSFIQEGKQDKMFLEANPKDRNINVYDQAMNKQNQGIRQSKGEEKSQSASVDKSNPQGPGDQRGADKTANATDPKQLKSDSNGKESSAQLSASGGGKAETKAEGTEKKSKVGIEMAERSRPKKKGMSI